MTIPKVLSVLRSELPPASPVVLEEAIAYQPGAVVSRTIGKAKGGSVTLFAFDAGQELSEHTAPFDAFVQVLGGAVCSDSSWPASKANRVTEPPFALPMVRLTTAPGW